MKKLKITQLKSQFDITVKCLDKGDYNKNCYSICSCAASVLIVDLVRQAPDNHHVGMPITLFVILATNSEIKAWLVPSADELIDIRRKRKWCSVQPVKDMFTPNVIRRPMNETSLRNGPCSTIICLLAKFVKDKRNGLRQRRLIGNVQFFDSFVH